MKARVESDLKMKIGLTIKHIHDLRNYKVSFDKAQKVLSFKPMHDVDSIVKELIDNRKKFKDFDNPNYYNIQVFKKLKTK